jgi:flagellum-specific ATP synthase
MLDRKLNAQGHYPPISVIDSLSRLMPACCSAEHLGKAGRVRQLLAAYAAAEDLIRVGAYQRGADAILDRAIAALPAIQSFVCQKKTEQLTFDQSLQSMLRLPD